MLFRKQVETQYLPTTFLPYRNRDNMLDWKVMKYQTDLIYLNETIISTSFTISFATTLFPSVVSLSCFIWVYVSYKPCLCRLGNRISGQKICNGHKKCFKSSLKSYGNYRNNIYYIYFAWWSSRIFSLISLFSVFPGHFCCLKWMEALSKHNWRSGGLLKLACRKNLEAAEATNRLIHNFK